MTVDSPETGPIEQTTDLNDHRDVDGFKYPFQVKTTTPVQTVSVSVTKVVHNTTLDPSIFSVPAN